MPSLPITRTTQPRPRVADPDLGFGRVFTDHMLVIAEGRVGDWTQRLFDTLTGIQYGKMEDPFGWTLPVSA